MHSHNGIYLSKLIEVINKYMMDFHEKSYICAEDDMWSMKKSWKIISINKIEYYKGIKVSECYIKSGKMKLFKR